MSNREKGRCVGLGKRGVSVRQDGNCNKEVSLAMTRVAWQLPGAGWVELECER